MCKKCAIGIVLLVLTIGAAIFILARDARGARKLTVVLNEIAWMGSGDTKQPYYNEWIELYNNTDSAIALEGWKITAKDGTPMDIELSGTIPANGYFLAERDNDDHPVAKANLIYGTKYHKWSLKNKSDEFAGEHLELFDASGNLIDEVDQWHAGNNDTKQTMEKKDPTLKGKVSTNWADGPEGGTPKDQNSNFVSNDQSSGDEEEGSETEDTNTNSSDSTSASNDSEAESDSDTQVDADAEVNVGEEEETTENNTTTHTSSGTENQGSEGEDFTKTGNIILNELMPSPEGSDSENEWIEIYNKGSEGVDISGWKIDDREGGSSPFTIPEGTTITADGYLLFSIKTTDIALTNTGDTARLLYPDNTIADSKEYNDAPEGEAHARFSDEWKWTDTHTPGSENIYSEEDSESTTTKNTQNPENNANNSINNGEGAASDITTTKADIGETTKSPSSYIPIAIATALAAAAGGGVYLFRKKFQ